jgi:hypothetical protein
MCISDGCSSVTWCFDRRRLLTPLTHHMIYDMMNCDGIFVGCFFVVFHPVCLFRICVAFSYGFVVFTIFVLNTKKMNFFETFESGWGRRISHLCARISLRDTFSVGTCEKRPLVGLI